MYLFLKYDKKTYTDPMTSNMIQEVVIKFFLAIINITLIFSHFHFFIYCTYHE